MSQSRQLAAIMFTDIVGYTALMGTDEKKAFQLLNKNRFLQKPIIKEFNGKFIKELGDGILASFNTVSDAVYAAIKIQEKCIAAKDFQLRIGIHLGDVLFENEDVFGDGVNIASRIQAIAEPNSIYISESVNQNVSNKQDINTQFVKQEALKNVNESVRIYEVLVKESKIVPTPREDIQSAAKNISDKSIAVLPFENMSSDPEQEYFSDGITDDVIAQLSKIRSLKVISRTSIIQYKNTKKSLLTIASELKVAFILEGTVRRSGSRIRIVTQLIDGSKDDHLWSETYDRDISDVFAIQSEIAENIAHALKTRLTTDEKTLIETKPTENMEAYSIFLLGRSHYYQMSADDFNLAIEYYNKAISLDPKFALPYAALAEARYYLGAGYFLVRPHDIVPDSFKLVQKALELNPNLADAYTARAELYDWYFFEWDKAEIDFKEAIKLNPSSAHAHLFLSYHHLARHRIEQAINEGRQALELDPNSLLIWFNYILVLIWARKFQEALREANALTKSEPGHSGPWVCVGLAASHLGLYEESINAFRESDRLSGTNTYMKLMLAYGLARAGRQEEARNLLVTYHKLEETSFVWPMGFALTYAYLGETGKAIHYLERSFTERVGMMCLIGCDPALDILRSEPRFKELIRKVGPTEAIAIIDKRD